MDPAWIFNAKRSHLSNQRLAGVNTKGVSGIGAKFVAYEQVSTARQGQSGLGLEAQRNAIEAFAVSRGAELLVRLTEVESGKNSNRPDLGKALHLAKVT